MSQTSVEIPLFPLKTVLFPGGPLPLKIFEPRYVDMIGRCLKEGKGFGVLAIREGEEAEDDHVQVHHVGTMARIADWYRMEDGLLGITAVGEARFYLQSLRAQPDGLNLGEVEFIEPDTRVTVPNRFRPLVGLLESIMGDMGMRYSEVERDFEDAGWLGCRLAEVLPLSLEQRQMCLESSDPLQRLEIIYPLLENLSS